MWIIFAWLIFWELLDRLGSVRRAWMWGDWCRKSGHLLCALLATQEALLPPSVCTCVVVSFSLSSASCLLVGRAGVCAQYLSPSAFEVQ